MTPVEPEELVEKIMKLDPHHICITGGEPLIQPKHEMQDFISMLRMEGYTMDLFTNGSQSFEMLPLRDGLTIVMDWKLTGSGEGNSNLEARKDNIEYLGYRDALKFVIANEADLFETRNVMAALKTNLRMFKVYLSPAWGLIEPAKIVRYVEEYNMQVLLSLQMHKYIWDPNMRGI